MTTNNKGVEVLSKAAFAQIMSQAANGKNTYAKVDWENVFAQAKAEGPMTAKIFYRRFIKGLVSEQRSHRVLDENFAKGKIARIQYSGANWYLFDEKLAKEQYEARKAAGLVDEVSE
jgi:hypothetical protein